MDLTYKQTIALDALEDHTNGINEVDYGGAAGGGKTALGCYWQLKTRLLKPRTRGLIGRATLKALKETTLATFFEIAKREGLKRGNHFDLTSSQDKQFPNCLVFANESLIYLKDLFLYPSDPDFDELGSLEITDAFLDECGQITEKAKNIVRSRIRFGLTDHGLIPKMLMSGNPAKNWTYYDFYLPSKQGTIRKDRMFVQALPGDNPYLPPSYIESLQGLDKNSRERLLEGNWEYDDDPAALMQYEKILEAFTNDSEALRGDKFLTCDVARFGSDRTVIGLWDGYRVKLTAYRGLNVAQTAQKLKDLQRQYGIPNGNTIADEDGVGGGVVDILGCKGFVNNSRPLPNPITHEDENYNNLKSQCYFKLAERINKNGLYIELSDNDVKQSIIQELEQVRQYNMDKDGKRQVLPKDKVKEIIGRSPDFADTLMMREYFELYPRIPGRLI